MFRSSRFVRSPFADIQNSLIRSFRLEQLLTQVAPKDLVLAKQENDRIFSFVAFPGLDHRDVAKRLIQVPSDMRFFHVVTGRERVPCDFFGDLDLDGSLTGKEAEVLCYQALREVHRVYDELYEARSAKGSHRGGGGAALETLVLHNPASRSKNSFHLHVHAPSLSLGDYRVAAAVADRVNAALKQPVFDMQCYRHYGMLRLAYNGKPNESGTELVPFAPSTAAFQSLLKSSSTSSCSSSSLATAEGQVAVLARSMALRPDATVKATNGKSVKICRSLVESDDAAAEGGKAAGRAGSSSSSSSLGGKGRSTAAVEFDQFGNKVHPFLKEANKMRRYGEARKALRQLPPRAADSYDTWVRVGLALHNFGCEEEFLDEWVLFSLRSPQKYSRDACAKKWERFGRPEDAFNWRRGYNYLTKTIWRELGLTRTR